MYDEAQADLLQTNWEKFLRRHNRTDADGKIFRVLLNNYGGHDRYYHTFWHINGCLALLAEARRDMPEWFADKVRHAAIELVLFEHDVIYDANASEDNEERSAVLAGVHANRLGFAQSVKLLLRPYILATKHQEPVHALGARVVCDIDLATLAEPWERFCEHTRQVREEYGRYSDEEFAEGRREFFREMLGRDRPIYQTGYFRDRFEKRARENLARVVND